MLGSRFLSFVSKPLHPRWLFSTSTSNVANIFSQTYYKYGGLSSSLPRHHLPIRDNINSLYHYDRRNRNHWFSSVQALSSTEQPIRILYASQGGTAQIFAQQLAEGLEEERPNVEVSIQGLHESKSPEGILTPRDALHVFLVSVTGVGEPPDNGRAFYEWIMKEEPADVKQLEYAVFGLGNQKAHPNHYNMIGKGLDRRLEELGASRVMKLGLGDDGDCIEDDFDQWMETFLKLVSGQQQGSGAVEEEEEEESPAEAEVVEYIQVSPQQQEPPRIACPGIATSEDGMRMISKKYPTIQLRPKETDIVRADLFHLQGKSGQFYSDTTAQLDVISNKLLTANAGETGLHEMRVSLQDHHGHKNLSYTTGDHLTVYPRNSDCIVQAYVSVLDVDPHAIIAEEEGQADDSYPHPKGLTVYETLSHCVDLGAMPSPAFARMLLGRKDLEYKNEIANPRRTVIDLLHESGRRLSLEDLLHNLAPMKARYYSIASSSIASPDEIRLAFRPVKYMSSRGILREGVCTSYLSHKGVISTDTCYAGVAAAINPNPTFRLPENPETPILLIAGGCGIAPIRAFVEERVAMNAPKYGPAQVYLGFRNPDDEVYATLIEEAIGKGALTDAKVSYSGGCTENHQYCMNVPDLVRIEADKVWEHLESGGYTYLCGGARTFGAAIEQELLEIIQEYGKTDFEGAQAYIRDLLSTHRLLEDLAD
jgi:NADPH-ferrihemoprotein reductase